MIGIFPERFLDDLESNYFFILDEITLKLTLIIFKKGGPLEHIYGFLCILLIILEQLKNSGRIMNMCLLFKYF